MNFESLNWNILDRLRGTFLEGKPVRRAYWNGTEDLAQYDQTFGERIGWKWDALVRELKLRRWNPPADVEHLIDWGCGSGVAGRRVLAAFPSLRSLTVFDHSPHAVGFAAAQAAARFPWIRIVQASAAPSLKDSMVVLSHVWNELPLPIAHELLAQLSNARVILWVEPGTHALARKLQAVREEFIERFDVVAPCTHHARCPLLASGHDRDWCHHFAPPPALVFTDGNWVRFARRAGVDLRSLPYSCLAMVARPSGACPAPPLPWSRTLGRADVGKTHATLHVCSNGCIRSVGLEKRAAPQAHATLKRDPLAVLGLIHEPDEFGAPVRLILHDAKSMNPQSSAPG